jgi:hypothetical protein
MLANNEQTRRDGMPEGSCENDGHLNILGGFAAPFNKANSGTDRSPADGWSTYQLSQGLEH